MTVKRVLSGIIMCVVPVLIIACPTGMTHITEPIVGLAGDTPVIVGENSDGWKVRKYTRNLQGGGSVSSYEMYDPVLGKWYPAINVGDNTVTMSDGGRVAWERDRGTRAAREGKIFVGHNPPDVPITSIVAENEEGWRVRKTGKTYEMYDPVLEKWYPATLTSENTVTMSDPESWKNDRKTSLPREKWKEGLDPDWVRETKTSEAGETGSADFDPDSVSGGGCTHLYFVDKEGREYFLGMTLKPVGEENEKWESLPVTGPVSGDSILLRFVKKMPMETTFIDQVRLRVEEVNPKSGNKNSYYLEGEIARKNSSGSNMRTAFLADGNHIPIRSSREPDPSSKWGVQRGDALEVKFRIPPAESGIAREYHVMTLGYHVKRIVNE